MKDLKLDYTGGHRLRIDDLNHFQDGIKQVLSYLAASFSHGGNKVILYGCDITLLTGPDRTQNTAGAILIDGEVFYLPAEIQSGHLASPEYQVVESYSSPSPVEYQNLVNRNVHRVREIRVATDAARAANYVIGYPITEFVNLDKKWVVPALGADWISKDQNSEGNDLQYSYDILTRKLQLRGCAHYTTGAVPGSLLFTLPAGLRPPQKSVHLIPHANATGVGISTTYCTVEANGNIRVDIAAGDLLAYHLDGVYFYI